MASRAWQASRHARMGADPFDGFAVRAEPDAGLRPHVLDEFAQDHEALAVPDVVRVHG